MIEEFESVQFALFTVAPPPQNALQFWSTMFQTSPTGFQTHSPGHTQAQGLINGLDVIIIAQAGRFDILMQSPMAPPPAMPPTPIPDIDGAISDGLSYAEKAIPSLKIGRVAAVIQGNCFASSSLDAVEKFKRLYPTVVVPAGATSVSYEYTIPKISKLKPERRLVRLCKWQTVQSQYLKIPSDPGVPQVAQRFAAHTYVDVFCEGIEALSAGDATLALREVVDEAKAIIDGGPDAIG